MIIFKIIPIPRPCKEKRKEEEEAVSGFLKGFHQQENLIEKRARSFSSLD